MGGVSEAGKTASINLGWEFVIPCDIRKMTTKFLLAPIPKKIVDAYWKGEAKADMNSTMTPDRSCILGIILIGIPMMESVIATILNITPLLRLLQSLSKYTYQHFSEGSLQDKFFLVNLFESLIQVTKTHNSVK